MNKEDFFISNFKNSYIGDDGAVVDKFVYSKDLFCEGIHFKREWMSLEEIAIKSFLVNISDVIVMNALPKYALLGVKIPKNFTKTELKRLNCAFLKIAKEYNIKIIGGDTIAGDKLDISITIISSVKNPIYRKGLKIKEYLAFTGHLGESLKDLKKSLRGCNISKNSKFIKPILRDKFFYQASKYITSAIDISDGLYKDLSRLGEINQVGFEFLKNFDKKIGCSGEEYEILFGFKKQNMQKIINIAKKTKTKITIFAKAKRGKFKNLCKENHF